MPAPFENIDETGDVAVGVGVRVFEGVSDARLGGEVNDDVEPVIGEKVGDRLPIGQVPFHEGEVFVFQLFQTGMFEADIVIVIQIVEADYLCTLIQQPFCQVETDKTGGAGN